MYEEKLKDSSEKIAEIDSRLFSVSSPGTSPVQGGANRREDMLCGCIDRKYLEEMRRFEAEEYFKDATPAWEVLSDEDKWVLTIRFVEKNAYDVKSPVQKVMEHFHCERSRAFEMISEALERFARALY